MCPEFLKTLSSYCGSYCVLHILCTLWWRIIIIIIIIIIIWPIIHLKQAVLLLLRPTLCDQEHERWHKILLIWTVNFLICLQQHPIYFNLAAIGWIHIT